MLGFCVLAPLGDAAAKLISGVVPLIILLFARFVIQAVLLLPLCFASGRSMRLGPRALKISALRGILHLAGIGAMFTAVRFLPLADAVAIAFVMPFIMLLLGWAVLGEEVGMRRIGACLIGFCGTLLVIQPAFEDVGWPALLPLVVAVIFAVYMLATRIIAKETDPIALQAVSGLFSLGAIVIWGAALFAMNSPALDLEILGRREWGLLCLIGVIGTFAHLMMSWALRFAPSATLAPMQYLEIPFATIMGWLVFEDWPNPMAQTGIVITIAAGIYIILREQRLQRAKTAPP